MAEARLALVGPAWPFRGGIARTTAELARALAARQALAAFLTPRRQYPRWLYPGGGDRDPAACPRLGVEQPCFGVLEPWTWGELRRRLEASAARAVVVPYWTWAWAPLYLTVLPRLPVPTVAVAHNAADHDATWLQRLGARLVLRRCQGFLCHARAVACRLERLCPGRPVLVHPLPAMAGPRVDRETARRQLGVPDGVTAVLCFGLLRPYKGVEDLLSAVERLPEGVPLRLLLAGEPWGELRAKVTVRLRQPPLAERVRAHLGWVAEEEVGWWVAAADAAVLPYRQATGSAVAALMLGHGLPLVASRVGGLAEVVEEGSNGLLVPPGDPVALAAALQRLTEPGLLPQLAAGARASAARWSWESYAVTLERLVAEVLTPAPVEGVTTTPPGR